MLRRASLILVVTVTCAAACWGSKKGTRGGTNVGPGSDEGGPWTQGGQTGPSPAAMPTPTPTPTPKKS